MRDVVSTLADIAAIATAVFAGWAYFTYRYHRRQKRQRLEQYLLEQRQGAVGDDTGTRSVTHLMARVGMTEADVLDAAFGSRHIQRFVARDPETGRAATVMLQYSGALWPPKPLR
jgi:hypothetical protein